MLKILQSAIFLGLIILYQSAIAQDKKITLSGKIVDNTSLSLPYVNVVLKQSSDSLFITGSVTGEDGRFSITGVQPGNYFLEISFIGYQTYFLPTYVGSLSDYLDVKTIVIQEDAESLDEIEIIGNTESVGSKLDKKTFDLASNVSQAGGSVLQSMQNLPGVSMQDGKVQLRGNENVAVLIDGKQTAITGFGSQSGLDNIPASAVERIEIITNPSSKFDANGNAGIINIILKKEEKNGLNGRASMSLGVGNLWERKENYPTVSAQYTSTPKYNPSLSLNWRKGKVNAFFQGDYLYTETLNKNEYVTRVYDDGTVINQQTKRNRDTHFGTLNGGIDWNMNDQNTFTISGMYGTEQIIDHGEEPFFNVDFTERLHMWQFLEDEVKTTIMALSQFEHKFKTPGRLLHAEYNYTFHREDEKYFFDNIYPSYSGEDAFALISDEQVSDLKLDYTEPIKIGRFETGVKFRNRSIPTNMEFFPGINSPIDSNAGGWATYREVIPAVYGNLVVENKKFEAEIGLRLEFVDVKYEVNPDHPVYKSDGYNYAQPFPNMRLGYKFNENNKLSVFFNRRVDRPNEVDIRIFPKYDDAEIIKVGNPALNPQFTDSYEIGYKKSWGKGYLYSSLYHKMIDGTITRISTTTPNSKLIYAVFQNVDKSYNTGMEMIVSQDIFKWYKVDVNGLLYYNKIDAYEVENLYPVPQTLSSKTQEMYSGNVKMNNTLRFPQKIEGLITLIYLAPDIIPQGTIAARFSVDIGFKKSVQNNKGEVFLNATDVFNTLIISQEIYGNDFYYTSKNYAETQVFRMGYAYRF